MHEPKVIFKEDTHQYFHIDTNEEYISCTTLLHRFAPEFDSVKMAGFCAKKQNKTTDEILKEWADNAKQSTDYGTAIHAGIEGYIKNKPTLYENNKYKDICLRGYELVTQMIGKTGIRSEELIWNEQYKIAGQSDIVQFTNGFRSQKSKFATTKPTLNILDIKTNKSINFYSEYDDRLLYPLEHLHNCNYNIYSLQLSLYAYMIEQLNPEVKVGMLSLIHYDRCKDEWIPYHCPYMLYEIKALLKIYNEQIKKIKDGTK